MKIARIALVAVMLAYGLPVPVLAQGAPEFALPGATAGKLYNVNIASVLRETYRLKVETDSRTLLLRWTFAGGELPPGLAIRANGTIVGLPRQPRTESYRFAVNVIDLAATGSQPLKVDLNLGVTARMLRLTQISMPRLNSLDQTDSARTASPRLPYSGATTTRTTQEWNGQMQTARSLAESESDSTNAPAYSSVRDESNSTTNVSAEAVSSDSRRPIPANYKLLRGSALEIMRGAVGGMPPIPDATPKPEKPSKADVIVDVSKESLSGDKIRGPATIELRNLNVLRYDIRIGKDATFPAAPDLRLPFVPPIPTQTPKTTATPAPTPKPPLGVFDAGPRIDPILAAWSTAVSTKNRIEGEKAVDVNKKIVSATNTVNLARGDLESLVTSSDSILATGEGASVISSEAGRLTTAGGVIDSALSATWPDEKIEDLLGQLEILKTDLLTLPTTPVSNGDTSWQDWYSANKSAYDAVVTRVNELQSQLNGLKSSAAGAAFKDAQKKLRAWKPILIGVYKGGAAGFNRRIHAGCGFAFDTGKETKIKIIKTDRWAEPGTAATNEEVVTVVCSSPLSVSAGFGFSNVDEREFVFVPSLKTVTGANGQTSEVVINRFGFRNKSGFRTLPVLLLNTRVWEPNDKIALHISTGAAVDVKTGQGGTDLEYIVGPSVSFWRSMFVTGGLHIGRVPKLAGGFQLDQEVPNGVSEPPLEKAWKKGFVATFTYKIR